MTEDEKKEAIRKLANKLPPGTHVRDVRQEGDRVVVETTAQVAHFPSVEAVANAASAAIQDCLEKRDPVSLAAIVALGMSIYQLALGYQAFLGGGRSVEDKHLMALDLHRRHERAALAAVQKTIEELAREHARFRERG